VDNHAKFLQDYKSIAGIAGLSSKLENEDLMSAVRTWLESQSNWLLVLDNADALQYFGAEYTYSNRVESSNLYRFVPQGLAGTILWTTRDERVVGGLVDVRQGINVTRMEQLEAETLLAKLSGLAIAGGDSKDATELLRQMDKLPLAIAQAAAYMRRTSTSIAEYVQKLKKEKRRWKLLAEPVFDRHRRPDVPNSVMKTFQISMDHIRQENPCAHRILHTIAYFDNQDIPFELIKAAARSRDMQQVEQEESDKQMEEEEMTDEDEDVDDILTAATRLKEFSFLRLRNAEDGLRNYEMHKLVQEATRYALDNDKEMKNRLQFPKKALYIMLSMFPNGDYGTWERCEVFLPHALIVYKWPEVSGEKRLVIDLLTRVSLYLFLKGRWRENESIERTMLKLRKEVLGGKHPDTIESMADLASTYHQQGRLKEAEEIKIKVLDLQKEVLGEKHPDTIESMADLASTYHQQGRLKEAEERSVKVLELREELLGEKHPKTIQSMADLAATYHQQGRLEEDEELAVKVLELQKEVLGEKHPDTIASMASLAATYSQQGRSKEDEELSVKVLELRKGVLGEKHPDTIMSMADLAEMYYGQGRSKEDEGLAVKVLELRKEVLGEKHPDTIQSMADLAVTYSQQGRLKEAEEIERSINNLQNHVSDSSA
jgi:tetratricopeptide (TPR) repeat protein